MFNDSFSHFVILSELLGEGDVLIYPNDRPVKFPLPLETSIAYISPMVRKCSLFVC